MQARNCRAKSARRRGSPGRWRWCLGERSKPVGRDAVSPANGAARFTRARSTGVGEGRGAAWLPVRRRGGTQRRVGWRRDHGIQWQCGERVGTDLQGQQGPIGSRERGVGERGEFGEFSPRFESVPVPASCYVSIHFQARGSACGGVILYAARINQILAVVHGRQLAKTTI